MSEDEKELLEAFDELLPENKANALAYIRTARIFQENTQQALYEKLGIPVAGVNSGQSGRISSAGIRFM